MLSKFKDTVEHVQMLHNFSKTLDKLTFCDYEN